MRIRHAIASSVLAAALVAGPAHADWYAGVTAGSGTINDSGSFGVDGLAAGFGGPTVDHDICGGTAVITIGAEPHVTHLGDSDSSYRVFVGWRSGPFGLELGRFNVAALSSSADSGTYAVAQPTCTSGSFTVSAIGHKVESVSFDGLFVAPVFSIPFAKDWTVDLRGSVAAWNRDDRSQWLVVVTELQSSVPFRTYPTAWSNGERGSTGIDVGWGCGVSWLIRDGVRVRGTIEDQIFDSMRVRSVGLGIAIDL